MSTPKLWTSIMFSPSRYRTSSAMVDRWIKASGRGPLSVGLHTIDSDNPAFFDPVIALYERWRVLDIELCDTSLLAHAGNSFPPLETLVRLSLNGLDLANTEHLLAFFACSGRALRSLALREICIESGDTAFLLAALPLLPRLRALSIFRAAPTRVTTPPPSSTSPPSSSPRSAPPHCSPTSSTSRSTAVLVSPTPRWRT
ncbi:hypothetical protein B0H15DRAFT_951792 [Mycena belliarum]|uniref:Uncharacterized protein n=1 Tax=Mycena belliarum TaxID=1033014 RepID=A0AAD6XSD8_9AGAR|nr:hypothetical protein B0H15DRAFT_951792 [Mycena belliae]